MDISRPDVARRKKLRQALYAATAVMGVVVVPVGVSRLEPAAPRVDRDTVYLDTVQRGPMTRQVRGAGTLVPERIRWIPATTDGTVERIVIRPGAPVAPGTVIVELSNPELEQSTLGARLNFEAAEARYSNRQVEVERDLLDQRATLATTEAQLRGGRGALQQPAGGGGARPPRPKGDAGHHRGAAQVGPAAGRRRRAASHAGPRLVDPAPAVAVGRAGVRDALRARAGTAADGHRHRRGAARDRAGRGGPPADAVRAAAAAGRGPAGAGRSVRRPAAGAARGGAAHHPGARTWRGWAIRRC